MRILVAPDKFKGSLGAADVAQEIARVLRELLPAAVITCLPVADGGEGTAEIICAAAGGEWRSCEVHDALGEIVEARYCTIDSAATAIMDASTACGLWRVPVGRRDPDVASSFGVGELLLDAAQRGASRIIIGLGGSATNDGGFGMARALGFRFYDNAGGELRGRVTDLVQLNRIQRPASLNLPEITAAADVRNPLLGRRGATYTYGEQKGASAEQLDQLEQALRRLAEVAARDFREELAETPGAGAAGGLGFGLMTFCNATVARGFDIVANAIGLESAVQQHDIVITGEGRLDAQTMEGKAPAGVAELTRKHRKRVIAIVGEVTVDDEIERCFDAVYSLATPAITTTEAMRDVRQLLRERAREVASSLEAS